MKLLAAIEQSELRKMAAGGPGSGRKPGANAALGAHQMLRQAGFRVKRQDTDNRGANERTSTTYSHPAGHFAAVTTGPKAEDNGWSVTHKVTGAHAEGGLHTGGLNRLESHLAKNYGK
jgi:hypothetical protein